MYILVACEESQVLTNELRLLGHKAYSCDIQETSGNHPEWHFKRDVLTILNPGKYGTLFIQNQLGDYIELPKKWDMIVAFPPCTDLASSGARWFEEKRKDGRQQASIEFFLAFADADCEKIAIENPIGIMSKIYRKPDQIIQPWMFGHGEKNQRVCG